MITTKTFARGALVAGAVAVAAVGAAGTAQADPLTTGNDGILNGNQAVVPIQVPVNVCGNAVAVAGISGAGCDGGAVANLSESRDLTSTGNHGIGNGNQADVPVQVPINACGNAVGAVVGLAGAGCDGGSTADQFESESESAEIHPKAADALAMAGDGGDLVTGLTQGLTMLPV
jgi:hypothetical protein